MRTAAAIFVAAHGVGHVIWFLMTWARPALGKRGRAEVDSHRSRYLVEPTSAAGKALGALAIVVLVAFVATGIGIWIEASWWEPTLLLSVIASLPILFTMWNPVGIVSFNALVANIGLGAATLMPWGERFLGVH